MSEREHERAARWKGLARRLWREVAELQRQLREAEAALVVDEDLECASCAVLDGLGVVSRCDELRADGPDRWTCAIPGLTRGDGDGEREAAEALQANLRALAAEPHELRAEVLRLRAEVEKLRSAASEPDGRMVRGRNDAETCRLSGWVVGDALLGEESGDAVLIQITAIGEERILARRLGLEGRESGWTLSCREWRRVEVDA